jgi:hypothetical protein
MALREHACYMLLKENEGRIFRLTFADGEVARAKVTDVDDEYEDFVYDLISSTIPEHYRDKDRDCYAGKFSELVTAELEEDQNESA